MKIAILISLIVIYLLICLVIYLLVTDRLTSKGIVGFITIIFLSLSLILFLTLKYNLLWN